MNYFDHYDEIRRLLDQVTALPDPVRIVLEEQRAREAQLRDAIKQASGPEAAILELATRQSASIVEELNKLRARVDLPVDIVRSQLLALEAATRPFPDLSWLRSASDAGIIEDVRRHLNASFLSARVLGQFDVDHRASTDDESIDTDESLIELVPAEALDDLRQVGFVPLILLDRVIRNPAILHQISARDFEALVATLIEKLGFEEVTLTPRARDGGRDVLATKRALGISILFAFECKRNSPDRPVGVEVARALFGTIMHPDTRADRGVLVTTSRLTSSAWRYVLTEPHLAAKEFADVVEWLREYEDSRRQRRTR